MNKGNIMDLMDLAGAAIILKKGNVDFTIKDNKLFWNDPSPKPTESEIAVWIDEYKTRDTE